MHLLRIGARRSPRRYAAIIVCMGMSCNARPDLERPRQPDDSPSGRYWLLPCDTRAMIGDSADTMKSFGIHISLNLDTVICTLASPLDPAIG